MKAMFTGFVAMTLIAIGAYFALHEMGFSSADVMSGPNVRLE
ncbi:hypothetical protein [Tropicibacter naphthalenivorans]|uniref:Uncharacterized protein n=1 Tax=Tropicibacter naphthalenivorans TaxID=441103 RepID=A0A0P1GFY4_9RHOB|nr:hypothetical protein [Tropicibacter naphthalenivorans]CUH80757.1 hypothetical protein TRN7648_03148 [Tropicibacter naphthalenivorans]SMC90043.1 hypothetical protein SAMN04488093_106118 [Tropicibacter naphthalenivorans]